MKVVHKISENPYLGRVNSVIVIAVRERIWMKGNRKKIIVVIVSLLTVILRVKTGHLRKGFKSTQREIII